MIYFSVNSEYISPLEMQRIVGIDIREVEKLESIGIKNELRIKGDPIKKIMKSVYRTNSFHLSIPYDEDIYFSYNLENVINILSGYKEGLKKINKLIKEQEKKNGGKDGLNDLSLSIGYPYDEYSTGLYVSVEIMKRLSECGINLDVCFTTSEKEKKD